MQPRNKALARNRCWGWKKKGRNTSRLKPKEETPRDRMSLLAGTPAIPQPGAEAEWGCQSTVRQEVAFRGEADCD